jgi:hypothetical protein
MLFKEEFRLKDEDLLVRVGDEIVSHYYFSDETKH